MADETLLNLYKSQLQQVEASLTSDPDNLDLLKLKKDLQEVIELTLQLLNIGPTSGSSNAEEGNGEEVSTNTEAAEAVQTTWSAGDACQALWSVDGQYYEAKIDEILLDGTCTVTFEGYGNTDITQANLLKPSDADNDHGVDGLGPEAKRLKSKKDLIAEEREKKRKKAQKKAQRMKQLEEERETEKNKWLDFNAKTFSKTNKGKVKRSIFASPDNINGRVGIGTCGTGGKPMTEYHPQEKWKK
ncbi:survival of motor neuron-related-splicing factor 30 [Octopus bimaculoides]|uniref:Survival of motor neuron-related-splicing factor 30 n=1 Tax=Octopus bimaculoides TaxID=37653 RepID=A0A0L8GQ26_OCTBM|nr:survival of motor neuron-related-splicing factor 30 [Octopus bimaculoides]|eukprot:XP_014779154.1 PREDICTED: survival of motor neuron-related-splicing factor 30-like [Octopus bimaculoides]